MDIILRITNLYAAQPDSEIFNFFRDDYFNWLHWSQYKFTSYSGLLQESLFSNAHVMLMWFHLRFSMVNMDGLAYRVVMHMVNDLLEAGRVVYIHNFGICVAKERTNLDPVKPIKNTFQAINLMKKSKKVNHIIDQLLQENGKTKEMSILSKVSEFFLILLEHILVNSYIL